MEIFEFREDPTHLERYQTRTRCGVCGRVVERWRLTTTVPKVIYLFRASYCPHCGEMLSAFTRSYKQAPKT
jgi:ribosomal protein L37E